MSFLEVEAVRRRQGAQEVLHGVDLDVPGGTILALLGQSGCGKTTLLRLIAGFEAVDAGRITLGGRVMSGLGVYVPAEQRRIGYVPQEGTLFPHLTVADNIAFGLTRAERRSGRVAETIRLTGLEGLEDRTPAQLSGGQQQRTALARALAPRPSLILLDEPFNALDMQLRRSVCTDVIALLRSQGATAILVTHDPQEAIDQADRIAVMRDGRIAQCADAETLYRHPADAAVARLTGAVVTIAGVVHGGQAETALGAIPVQAQAPEGRVTVLLRPEQIVPDSHGRDATVMSCAFRGEHNAVMLQAGDQAFEARLHGPAPMVGSRIGVRVEGAGTACPLG